jgi:acyl-CoA synthetase (AMP-forming)/AMP-acid ligase II
MQKLRKRFKKLQINFTGIRQEMDKNHRKICVQNPFFHAYGVVIAISNALNHGSTIVLPAPHFSPEASLKAISKEKCDVIYGTPTSKKSK